MHKGLQISVEGVDGSGKTTLISRISEALRQIGLETVVTNHPGSTPIGKVLRGILKQSEYKIYPNTEALLFAADNSAYINQILLPSLIEKKIVLADRNNFISSLAYQIASGCTLDELDRIHAAVTQPPKMDLLIILKVDWDTACRRAATRAKEGVRDRFEDQGKTYFDKVCTAYDNMLTTQSTRLYRLVKPIVNGNAIYPNVHYIDATKDQDVVLANSMELINKLVA